MKRFLVLSAAWTALALVFAAALWASAAHAGRPRYHPVTFTIATADCPTGTPGVNPVTGAEWGISLSDLRGWKVTLCAEDEETITGAGSLKVCTYSAAPWGPGEWALSPEFTWDMTDRTSGTRRCVELSQLAPAVSLSDRVFVYPSTDFGVSGGTTLEVYLTGEMR